MWQLALTGGMRFLDAGLPRLLRVTLFWPRARRRLIARLCRCYSNRTASRIEQRSWCILAKVSTCAIAALLLGACRDPAPVVATNSGMGQANILSEARRQVMLLLTQVADRYKSVATLSCQIRTTARASYSDRPDFDTRGTASLIFERAINLEVRGRTPGGPVPSHSYSIVSHASGARTRIDVEGESEWREHTSLEDALAALSGATKRAPVILCAFLCDLQWDGQTKNFPTGTIVSSMMSTVTAKEDVIFGGVMCTALQARCAGLDVTLYVRKADSVLVGCTEVIGSKNGVGFVKGSRYPMTGMSMTQEFSDVRLR
jgi:hypothetical protein